MHRHIEGGEVKRDLFSRESTKHVTWNWGLIFVWFRKINWREHLCSPYRQRDIIAAPRRRRHPPPSSPPPAVVVAAARRRNLLLGATHPNVNPCEERRRSAPASARDVVYDGGHGGRRAPPTPAPCHMPPRPPNTNSMLIVTSLLKPDAAALQPRQHRVRRPKGAPTIPLASSPSSRWLRRPRALASSSSVARLTGDNTLNFFCFFVLWRFIDHLLRFAFSGVFRRFPAFSGVFRRFPAFSGVFRRFPAFSGIFRSVGDKIPLHQIFGGAQIPAPFSAVENCVKMGGQWPPYPPETFFLVSSTDHQPARRRPRAPKSTKKQANHHGPLQEGRREQPRCPLRRGRRGRRRGRARGV